MNRFLFLAAAALVLAAPVRAAGPKARGADEKAIRQVYASYEAAWNAGDAKRVAAVWADDAEHVEADGRVITGRTAIGADFAQRLATVWKGSQLKQTVESIRFIKPDVAVVDAAFEVTGGHDAAGKPLPPVHGRYADIWVKKGGSWHIAADRPLATAGAAK